MCVAGCLRPPFQNGSFCRSVSSPQARERVFQTGSRRVTVVLFAVCGERRRTRGRAVVRSATPAMCALRRHRDDGTGRSRLACPSRTATGTGLSTGRRARRRSQASRLAVWMTGSFSSATQAAAEPDDDFDIRLFMQPIWTERADGCWLSVEQAAASALERPYRQRVDHLVDTGTGPRSDVFELPGDPLDFAVARRRPPSPGELRCERQTGLRRRGRSLRLREASAPVRASGAGSPTRPLSDGASSDGASDRAVDRGRVRCRSWTTIPP